MVQKIQRQECFACGKEYIGVACPHCGYSYSIKDKCPNLHMGICQRTKSLCMQPAGNYTTCELLIQQDND